MASSDVVAFRALVREWLEQHFPRSLVGKSIGLEGEFGNELGEDFERWVQLLAEQGWGVPTWPKEYGGAGLSRAEAKVLKEEMAAVGAWSPITILSGMGVSMVGPTLLDYGTEEQKRQHLPGIASGQVRWCLGLSEPNAGSDLASLSSKAQDNGDHYVINGQKVWTSVADRAHWCAALVRTESGQDKRAGLSVLMMPMGQPGIEVRPIQLISGASPFCETFFNDAVAAKDQVLGPLGAGWKVIKRLLQHERQSQTEALGSSMGAKPVPLHELAKKYVGVDERGELCDADLRVRLVKHEMDARAHALTIARVAQEAKSGGDVSDTASILKNSATRVSQTRAELVLEIMGAQGIGWEGAGYEGAELQAVRDWLMGKAASIYGGTFEIQNNIIAKNILGLPETTQKG